jgi:hypothetical protein
MNISHYISSYEPGGNYPQRVIRPISGDNELALLLLQDTSLFEYIWIIQICFFFYVNIIFD